MTRKKCAIYCRVNKNEGKYNNRSELIEQQRAELCEFSLQNNMPMYNMYIDIDTNTAKEERSAFNDLIEDARNGCFNIIICSTLASFTDDAKQLDYYLHKAFKRWNVQFIAIHDGIDTRAKSNKKARQINNRVNEWYMVNAEFNTGGKKSERAGSFLPYGYKKSYTNKNIYEKDYPQCEVVKEIFTMYMSSQTQKTIAEHLNSIEAVTPAQYRYLHSEENKPLNGGTTWNEYTIEKILINEVYTGSGKRYPKLISEETYKAVQQKIKNNCKKSKTYSDTSLLEGLVYCHHCGAQLCRMCCTYKGRQKYFLRCKNSSSNCCLGRVDLYILTEDIKKIVTEHTEEYLLHVDKHIMNENYENRNIILDEAINSINNQIDKIKKMQKEIYTEYSGGALSREEYIKIKMHNKDDIIQYYSSLKHLTDLSSKNKLPSSRYITSGQHYSQLTGLLINKITIKRVANQFTSTIFWNF